jgi:hypothetical protein
MYGVDSKSVIKENAQVRRIEDVVAPERQESANMKSAVTKGPLEENNRS